MLKAFIITNLLPESIKRQVTAVAAMDYLLTKDGGVENQLKKFISGILVFLGFIFLIFLAILVSIITGGLAACILFCLMFPYAKAYGKAPMFCSLLLLTSGILAMTLSLTGGHIDPGPPRYYYVVGGFLCMMAVFSYPIEYHPPVVTSYNALRFMVITPVAFLATSFFILPIAMMMGLNLNARTTRWEIFLIAGIGFVVMGLFLNKQLFSNFEWVQLEYYHELKSKYGDFLDERSKEIFFTKLKLRFGDDFTRERLIQERNNDINLWQDRIMFAYLYNHLYK